MWRPKNWDVDRITQNALDDLYCDYKDSDLIEAGADAMLCFLRDNQGVSVLSYSWALKAEEWAARNRGRLVLIPDEEVSDGDR